MTRKPKKLPSCADFASAIEKTISSIVESSKLARASEVTPKPTNAWRLYRLLCPDGDPHWAETPLLLDCWLLSRAIAEIEQLRSQLLRMKAGARRKVR